MFCTYIDSSHYGKCYNSVILPLRNKRVVACFFHVNRKIEHVRSITLVMHVYDLSFNQGEEY